MTIEKLFAIAHGLNRRFTDGNQPYKIMTCLLEEGGELAQMINHFEGAGTKLEKYGPPDTAKLVKEIRDVLLCGLRVAIYYGVEGELEAGITAAYEKMRAEGWIQD